MSVIVTGMDMPKNCKECRKESSHEIVGMDCILLHHTDCPLKSIDGLIERMENMKDIPDQGTWRAAIDECIATVKEYCEVSE